jgi:hypothetical protein
LSLCVFRAPSANGISELAQFDIEEAHDKVITHINHSKKEVRREIQFYLVKLFSLTDLPS